MDRCPYEEIVVPVQVIGSTDTVPAVTLRAAKFMQLRRDAPPSSRYRDLIAAGARELGLASAPALEVVPAVTPSKTLAAVAKAHGIFSITCFRLGIRRVLGPLRTACYLLLYAGPSTPLRVASEFATCVLLAPTACLGVLIRAVRRAMGRPEMAFGPPPPRQEGSKPQTEGE